MIHQLEAHCLLKGDSLVLNISVVMAVLPCLMTVLYSADINCRARLFDLAVSLLPGLDDPALDLLYSAIKLALQVG